MVLFDEGMYSSSCRKNTGIQMKSLYAWKACADQKLK